MENKLINMEAYLDEVQAAENISDPKERDIRHVYLEQIWKAVWNFHAHKQEYRYKEFQRELKERGLRFTPVHDRTTKAKWTKLFAASVPKEKRQEVHFEQFKWHLFSFELLNALEDDAARAAFDAEAKDTLFLFWQHTDKAYLVENAHLFKAKDFDHDFIPFSDFYLFSPEGKWTYIHTHESMCGPYFYKLP